jgi:peptidyl-prolyl cis-trans isomerase B (cyclophilin B)
MLRLVVLCVVCALLVVACGDDEPADNAATPAATEAGAAGCEQVEEPAAKPEGNLPKPKEQLDPAKTYVATVSTNCGDFEITLDAKRAPKTGGSFKYLADEGFYDGLGFHRVIDGFVIQGGDPRGDGQGGPGYQIVEAPPQDLIYERGIVAMAKSELEPPGTSGSQFFVVTAEVAQLGPDFALVGKITAGQDVVDKINVVETDPATERPLEPVVMSSVKVTER